MVDAEKTKSFVNQFWDESIVPTITEYIRIPNKSVAFDPDWEKAGHMEDALQLALDWLEQHPIPGAHVQVGRQAGRTPLILLDCPGEREGTVLMYGHLDKQPEMTGWRADLGPWQPKLEDGKLYGRGGADDGYALFASICALSALADQGRPRSRTVVLIEFSEESGSPDLPYWVEHFSEQIGKPDVVICLDSGAGNYEQLWSTTSLRGLVSGTIDVHVLDEGVHSGDASGIVPSSFRIARQLLSRLEDPLTGKILPESLYVEIPSERLEQAKDAAGDLGDAVWNRFPWASDTQPLDKDPVACMLNRSWRPALSMIGVDGMPSIGDAGNVLRPNTCLKFSLRLPPTIDAITAAASVKDLFSTDIPQGADVRVSVDDAASGWHAPPMVKWLSEALDSASNRYFGKGARHLGEGGSIPFMAMLHAQFPEAQFVVTGVLGPGSNAHGPNEFLHVPYAKGLTACIVDVLDSIPSN